MSGPVKKDPVVITFGLLTSDIRSLASDVDPRLRGDDGVQRELLFKLQNIPRLAVQVRANTLQGREAHRFCFACLQNRKILNRDTHMARQVLEFHFAFGEHNVEINNNWHHTLLKWLIVVLLATLNLQP